MRKLLIISILSIPLSLFAQKDSIWWKENALLRAGELEITFKVRDYKHYAKLNHPRLVEMAGGMDELAKVIEEQMKQIETVKIDSMEFGEPFNFVKCDSALNCLITQTMLMQVNDSLAIRSTVYLLGTSEDEGKTWYFVDASNGAAFLDTIIPVRCKNLVVPNSEQTFVAIRRKD